ncbi:hypothetical protein H6P81_012909 [Aristolochia fimbriata]|uniref:Uncharacterized protein n=1 Tax=Aristolochia fimbriata TaxID=158543 RepID=A0AAV7EEE0_ARIFI|nr:hypothetical protein H6P81_012909 [Aristolochia fimbriata]
MAAPQIKLAAFFVLLQLIGSLNPAAASEGCHFPAIFNFGDSNSDTGGLAASLWPAPWPNGETFFGRPAGRFSDGRLVVDFMADSMGLPYLSAYLDSVLSNFTHGANFATAGATIRVQNTTWFQSGYSPFPLDVQLRQFTQFKSKSLLAHQQGGGVFKHLVPKEEYFSQGLYAFDIGQNDLTAGLFLNMTVEEVKASVPEMLNIFALTVKEVYQLGGRFFWVHNTGPLGCLAYVLERLPIFASQIDKHGCATPSNELALYFNSKLKKTVIQLRKELPLATFTYVDIYSAKYTLISRAKQLGFEHPLRACCGHGGKYNYNQHEFCGSTKTETNGTLVLVGSSCEDPRLKIVWDGIHYTEAANRWVFKKIFSGAFTDPPTPFKMACRRTL